MENIQGKEGIYASLDLSKKGRITVHDLGLTLLPGSQIQTEGGHEVEEVDPSEQNVASGEEQGERVGHDASRTAGETQIALALAPFPDRNTLKRKVGDGRKGAAETTYSSGGDEGDLGDDESKEPRGNWTRKVPQPQKRRRLTKDVVPGGGAAGSGGCQRLSRMWRMKGGKRTSLLNGVQGNTSLRNQPQPPAFPPPESVLVSSRHGRSTGFYVSDNSTDSGTSTFTSESGLKVRTTLQRAPVAQKASIFSDSQPKASFEPFESFVRSPATENRQKYSQQVSRVATATERRYRTHRSRPVPAKALAPTDPASYSILAVSGLQHPIYSTAPGLDFVSNPGVEQLQDREQHLLSPDRETSSASQSPEYTQALVEANDRSRLRASSSPMSSSYRYQPQGSTEPYAANDNTHYANVYQSQGSTNSYAANDNTSYPNFGQSQRRTNQYAASNNIVDANYGQSQGNANLYVERVRPIDASSHANLNSMGPAREQTPWSSIADANTPLDTPVPHSNVTRPSQAPHASTSSKNQSQGSTNSYAANDNTSYPNFGQSQRRTNQYAASNNIVDANYGQSQGNANLYVERVRPIDASSHANLNSMGPAREQTPWSSIADANTPLDTPVPHSNVTRPSQAPHASTSSKNQSQGSTNSYAANDNTSYPNFGQPQGRTNQYAASNNIVDANYGQSWGNASPYVERVRPTDASSHANLSSMGPAHEQTPRSSIADANTPLDPPVPHSNVTIPPQAPHASTSSQNQFLTTPYVDAILRKICLEMDVRRSNENEIYDLMLKLVQTFPVSGQRSVPAGQYYGYVVAEKLKELKARITQANEEMTRLKDEAAWKGRETLLLKQQIDQLWQKNQRLEYLLRLRPLPQVKPAAAVICDQERRTASLPSATFVHWNPQATIDLTGEDTAPAPAVAPKRKAAVWLEGYNPLNKHPRLSLHGEPTPHEQHLQREPQAGANSGSDGGQSEVARKNALKDAANARRRARRAEERRRREDEEEEEEGGRWRWRRGRWRWRRGRGPKERRRRGRRT
ncbi:MAG: hypothetical protein FRX48_05661 [Lasallia pustulata]|uniref:Uncharacterized protein n=1 Tax=Lasallia pustulata TaxID=136370 RepID=A0A5M8PMT1_9LECA|nr:MAG: hypothetical protein FRX48_05661 [Lasallia pustulata]